MQTSLSFTSNALFFIPSGVAAPETWEDCHVRVSDQRVSVVHFDVVARRAEQVSNECGEGRTLRPTQRSEGKVFFDTLVGVQPR